MIQVNSQFKMPSLSLSTKLNRPSLDSILKIDINAIVKKKMQDIVRQKLSGQGYDDEFINKVINALMGVLK